MVSEGGGGVRLPLEWYLAREVARVANVPEPCVEAEACLVKGILLSIDGYSSRESKPGWISWSDWGWRSVVAAISDIIASGGRPLAIAVSLGVRDPSTAAEVMRGVKEAASFVDAVVASGDLNRAESEEWIDVAVVGEPLRWIRRVGAEPGDVVVQVGELGYGGLAQAITEGRISAGGIPSKLVQRASRPRPVKGFEAVARECNVKAAIDNSDGWAYSLAQLAAASGVSINLLEVVVPSDVARIVEALGLGPVDEFGLKSWEDYNVAAVVDRDSVDCFLRTCERVGLKCWRVGEVLEGEPGLVTYRGEEVKITGWSSFSG